MTAINITASLAVAATDKLAKICGLFSSHHDRERAAAAAKADSIVREMGLTWPDVVRVPSTSVRPRRPKEPHGERSPVGPKWREQALRCTRRANHLDGRSRSFLNSLLTQYGCCDALSVRQQMWLDDIEAKLTEAAP
jgi:hypothetical protein